MIQNQDMENNIRTDHLHIPTLRDKQKLFSKLFINSTYFPVEQQHPLIVQPTFINLILKQLQQLKQQDKMNRQLKQVNSNRQHLRLYKKSVILQILEIIKHKQQNSILIYNHDRDEQTTVLDTIIMEIVKLIDSQQDVQTFGKYIQPLTRYYFVKMKNVTKLTQYLSKAFYKQKFNPFKLKFIINVIHQYYRNMNSREISSQKSIPSYNINEYKLLSSSQLVIKVPFFYCYGQSSMGIRTIIKPINQHFQQPIKNQFSFVMCFLITQAHVLLREKPAGLLRFKTNKQQITLQIINKKIHIVNQLNQQSVYNTHTEILPNKIYRIVINFTHASTQLAINAQIHTLQPLIKKHSEQRVFQSVVFGQSFEGMLFSLLMLNKKIEIQKQLPYLLYPYGIQKWSTLNKLKTKNNYSKLLQKIVLAYLPFTIFESRYKMYCFDIFRKIHGQLLDNVIVLNQSRQINGSSNIMLGGIQTVLPLFYLARFYPSKEYRQLLNDLLQLLETIVHNSNIVHYKYGQRSSSLSLSSSISSSIVSDHLQQHFNKDTFLILGNLVSNLSPFYTQQTFNILLDLFFKFNDEQKLHFINHFLWNINISLLNNQQTIKSFYLLLIKIYQNNKSIILKAKTITDIVYWAVQHFQKRKTNHCLILQEQVKTKILLENIIDLPQYHNMSHSDQQNDKLYHNSNDTETVFYCCLQHYLNQSVLYTDFNIHTAQKMTLKSHALHYSWLEKILSILLQYHFILNLSQAEESIAVLLRFLMKKYSTCFYLFIIKAIKRQLKTMFSSSRNIDANRNFIQALHQKHHILSYLQFLAQKTISLDLVTEIIQFHLFFYQAAHLKTQDKLNILEFIQKTIRRLSDVYNCQNPVKIGVKKIRKLSDQLNQKYFALIMNNQHHSQEMLNNSQNKLTSFQKSLTLVNKKRQKVLQSSPMTFSGYESLFYLIQNYLTGQMSQQQITDNVSIKFKSQQAFLLFKVYYQCLPRRCIYKLKVLRQIEKYVNSSSLNKVFLMRNSYFLETVICQLSILKNSQALLQGQSEIVYCIQRVLNEFLQTFLKQNQQHQFQIDLRMFFKNLKQASKDKVIDQKKQTEMNEETQQAIIQKLNYKKFITVIKIIESFLCSITQQLFMQPYVYNFIVQVTLVLIEEIYLLKPIMSKKSKQLQSQKQKVQQNELTKVMKLLNNIVNSLYTKILNPIKQKFHAINKSTSQYPLCQDQLKKQSQCSVINKDKPQLSLSTLSYAILQKYHQYFSAQNRERNSSQLKHIPMPSNQTNNYPNISVQYSLFDLKLSTINQGEINFVFQIIIPKLTSHFWLLYGESLSKKGDISKAQVQKSVLLRDIVEKYLNKSTVKIVYVFEILLDYMFQEIDSIITYTMEIINKQTQQTVHDNIQKVTKILQVIIEIYNMLAVEVIFQLQLKQETLINDKSSLLKMITYLISGFFIHKIQSLKENQFQYQGKHLFINTFLQSYTKLWSNIFHFLFFFVKQTLDQSQGKLIGQISSYEELLSTKNNKNNKNKLSLFYMDLLRFSLLDRKSNEIITFEQLKQIYLLQQKDQKDLSNNNQAQQLISEIITKQQFKQSISLNNQIQLILSKLTQININSLSHKSQKSFKSININNYHHRNSQSFSNTAKSNKSIVSSVGYSEKVISNQNKLCHSQSLSSSSNVTHSNNNKVDMQRILEKENVLEEDMRAVYFFNQELQVRRFHKIWQKLWKTIRLYHHPYGLSMAMRMDSHHYQYKPNTKQIKNFTYKISKYSSSSGIKPILQARIIQPWHIIKTKLLQNKQQIAYLNDMIQSAVESSISKKTNDMNESNGQKLNMLNIWNYMWKIPAYYMGKSSNGKSKSRVFNVVWIKGNVKAQGRVSLNNNDQIQFWFNGIRQQDSHLTFQKFTLPFNKQLFKKWPLIMLKKISQRRYLMKYHALEFQFIDSLLVLLYFVDNDEKEFLQLIEDIRQEKIIALGSKIKANGIEIFESKWYSPAFDWNQLSELTEKWRLNQISNLSYLVRLNILASRSGLDLSQYPVIPWIASITNDKQPILRDLTKTLGALGSQERVNSLKQKFNSKDPFNPVPAFHYGTHYSSPGVVFNFLIRVSPFTQYLKSLQGGRFDLPDRLFSSLISSWKSTFTQISDVRQLVPQFYYLPEILINLQGHNFGYTQSLQKIDHVDLPLWTVNNPYYFVIQFRQMLESCQASQHINQWIDLIFGYRQKGQEAQKSINLYYYLTYEEYNDLDNEQDEVYKKSCQAQVVHFGQVPPQLFEKPHPKRLPIRKQLMQIRLINKFFLMNKLTQPPAGIHLQEQKKSLTIIKRNCIEHYSLQKNPISLLKANKFNLQRSSSELFYLWRKDTAKVVFFSKHPYFISISYVNHQMRIYNKVHGKIEKQEILDSKINSVHLNQEENLIIVGCEDGILTIYQLQYESNGSKLFVEKVHQEVFPHSINHISQRDGWTVISFGSYCSVYKISRSLHYLSVSNSQHYYKPCAGFIRSFKNPLKVLSAYIITSPLYSLILVDNAGIKCYSINGQFIKSLSCNPKSGLFILRDNEMNEFVYFLEDERIVVMSTPDLRSVSEMEVGVKCLGLCSDGLLVFEQWIGKVGW